MVYVLNSNGEPLMPCKEAKARKLLKANRAKVVKKQPFTIQLLFECENKTQDTMMANRILFSGAGQADFLISAILTARK